MAIIPRNGKYGVQVYRHGAREWVGTFETKAEAKRAEREAMGRRPAGPETCREFAERWPEEFNAILPDGSMRWSDEHARGLRSALRPFIARFGHERLGRFPLEDAYPWSVTQRYFTVKAVRAMFNDAVKSHLCDSNPFSGLGIRESRGRADIIAITEAELELLAECARDTGRTREHGEIMRALVEFVGVTGLRGIGARNLRPEDVNPADRTIYVRKPGKGVAPRRIFLPDRAAEAVARMPRRLAPWLFTSVTGGKLTKANLHYAWDPVRVEFERRLDPRRAAELSDSRPKHNNPKGLMQFHELRHCACTIMARRGVDPGTAAWQLCQTDEGDLVKRVYTHLTDTERQGMLARAFDGLSGEDRRAPVSGERARGVDRAPILPAESEEASNG